MGDDEIKNEIDSTENDDVVFEEETDSDMLKSGKGVDEKMKALKDKLAVVTKEKQEYLDGWQRANADLANQKRRSGDELERMQNRLASSFFQSIFPVLDSFDQALKTESSDKNWREGIEQVHSQFIQTLSSMGLEKFDSDGEKFDPMLHETVATDATDDEASDHIIKETHAYGYKFGDRVVRPAKVTVFVYNTDTKA